MKTASLENYLALKGLDLEACIYSSTDLLDVKSESITQ